MSETKKRVVTLVGVLGLAGLWAASGCDAIIGIEELSTPPPTNNGTTCELPQDCPGTGNPCLVRSCVNGQCQVAEVPDGPTAAQTPGDCQTLSCAMGQPASAPDPADTMEDGNPCTVDACTDGAPSVTNASSGTTCTRDNMQPGVCDGDGGCVECVSNAQCTPPATCNGNHRCVAPHCSDGQKNMGETDVDCGGQDCPPCGVNKLCENDSDCTSLVCKNGHCAAPSCSDNTQNAQETDVDCGGPDCNPCELGKTCMVNEDCSSIYCECMQQNCTCAPPACDDGLMNGTEIDVDCGPDCDHTCADGLMCLDNVWCISSVCNNNSNTCSAPSCSDGVLNGSETMVDCGGTCDPCG